MNIVLLPRSDRETDRKHIESYKMIHFIMRLYEKERKGQPGEKRGWQDKSWMIDRGILLRSFCVYMRKENENDNQRRENRRLHTDRTYDNAGILEYSWTGMQ